MSCLQLLEKPPPTSAVQSRFTAAGAIQSWCMHESTNIHKRVRFCSQKPKCNLWFYVSKSIVYCDSSKFPPSPQDIWWVHLGHQAKGSSLPFRLHRCHQSAVSGLLPLPLLRLHVACHHLWRVTGRGHRGTCGKRQYCYCPQETLVIYLLY